MRLRSAETYRDEWGWLGQDFDRGTVVAGSKTQRSHNVAEAWCRR